MNDDLQLAQKLRNTLNQGTQTLDRKITDRLYDARRNALAHQRQPVRMLSLAGIGHVTSDHILPNMRALTMAAALVLGAMCTYYWNNYQQADENEEIDSALLSDDLPINAYLDRGFQAWVDHSSPSSP